MVRTFSDVLSFLAYAAAVTLGIFGGGRSARSTVFVGCDAARVGLSVMYPRRQVCHLLVVFLVGVHSIVWMPVLLYESMVSRFYK